MVKMPEPSRDPLADRLAGMSTNIFSEMTQLAQRAGAINLGQGVPEIGMLDEVTEAAVTALQSGIGANQYAPVAGVELLREAVRAHQRQHYGLECEDVQITFGATEAVAAALLALVNPGDEVVVLEPFYDAYAACVQLAGARLRPVTLRAPAFAVEEDVLEQAILAAGGKAHVLVLNSPHNPTGRVLTRRELEVIAKACIEHDLTCISDEVYEHLVYDGEHIPITSLDGMAERTLTVSSIAKTFSLTGWKVGWCTGPVRLVRAVRTVKQFLTFSGGTPFQHAAAAALMLPDEQLAPLRELLRQNRDALAEGIRNAGWQPLVCAGTYFMNADVGEDATALCQELPQRCGVAAIPTAAFYADPSTGASLVRLAFCKRPETIAQAAVQLQTLHRRKWSLGWWLRRRRRHQLRPGLNPPA
jgi:N-succinyldiaminopimelate aminotransferase